MSQKISTLNFRTVTRTTVSTFKKDSRQMKVIMRQIFLIGVYFLRDKNPLDAMQVPISCGDDPQNTPAPASRATCAYLACSWPFCSSSLSSKFTQGEKGWPCLFSHIHTPPSLPSQMRPANCYSSCLFSLLQKRKKHKFTQLRKSLPLFSIQRF